MLWNVRFRSPISPTRGVYQVMIETDTDDLAEAERVAKDYLDREMSHPSTRLIPPLMRAVVNSSKMIRDRAKDAAKAASQTGDAPDAAASAGRGGVSSRVGA